MLMISGGGEVELQFVVMNGKINWKIMFVFQQRCVRKKDWILQEAGTGKLLEKISRSHGLQFLKVCTDFPEPIFQWFTDLFLLGFDQHLLQIPEPHHFHHSFARILAGTKGDEVCQVLDLMAYLLQFAVGAEGIQVGYPKKAFSGDGRIGFLEAIKVICWEVVSELLQLLDAVQRLQDFRIGVLVPFPDFFVYDLRIQLAESFAQVYFSGVFVVLQKLIKLISESMRHGNGVHRVGHLKARVIMLVASKC